MTIHDITDPTAAASTPILRPASGIERKLCNKVAAEETGEPRLAATASPDLRYHRRTGRQCRLVSICQQYVSANTRQSLGRARSAHQHRGRRLSSGPPGAGGSETTLERLHDGAARQAQCTRHRRHHVRRASARAARALRSRRSGRARALAFARIASAIQALTDGARPARTSASATRARSSSRLMVIRRIRRAYACMHSVATA